MKCTAIVFALCAVSCSSWQLVFTNNPETIPGIESVWTVDQTGNFSFIASQSKQQPSWDGAAVCDGIYYAVWGDQATQGYGIASYDLVNKKVGDAWTTEAFFHQLACDPKNPKAVIGSASAMSAFYLKRFDTNNQNETTIGSFPSEFVWGGHTSIFDFTADGAELWTACTNGFDKGGGNLYVMDTTTGTMKNTYKLQTGLRDIKTTFSHVFATSNTSGTANAIMVKAPNTDNAELVFTQLTLKGSTATISKKKTNLNRVSDSGERAWVHCGGMECQPYGEPDPTKVVCYDAEGNQKLNIDVSEFPGHKTGEHLGGMACWGK